MENCIGICKTIYTFNIFSCFFYYSNFLQCFSIKSLCIIIRLLQFESYICINEIYKGNERYVMTDDDDTEF